ncbi:MAG: endonuclease domain-containing protein [Bacteroidaceae bacterium]|nr:endonuclease domain-containing protein [Bacteroidaceae bacterium]
MGDVASYKTSSPDRYELLKVYARENRKHATTAEQYLWEQLRRGGLGVDFLRQHIIGDYIADFASRHGGLIIEVDGGYHAERQQAEDDAVREKNLEDMGYHIMRFTNEEVLFDIDNVLDQIENYFVND